MKRDKGGAGKAAGAKSGKKTAGGRRQGCLALLLAAVFTGLLLYVFREQLREAAVDDTRYEAEIRMAAGKYGLDPQLVRAVIFQESRFNPVTRGRAGEVGLMQVLPSGAVKEWAASAGRRAPTTGELEDPKLNIEIGCWYLARGMRRYGGYKRRNELALCFYNAGDSRVKQWLPEQPGGEVLDRIDIASTRKYVSEIMKRYSGYLKKAERKQGAERR